MGNLTRFFRLLLLSTIYDGNSDTDYRCAIDNWIKVIPSFVRQNGINLDEVNSYVAIIRTTQRVFIFELIGNVQRGWLVYDLSPDIRIQDPNDAFSALRRRVQSALQQTNAPGNWLFIYCDWVYGNMFGRPSLAAVAFTERPSGDWRQSGMNNFTLRDLTEPPRRLTDDLQAAFFEEPIALDPDEIRELDLGDEHPPW